LEFPFASDLFASETWQGILRRGDKTMGRRSVSAFLKRPAEELYDLENDPLQGTNLVGDPLVRGILEDLRRRLETMRRDTGDPWLINDRYRRNRDLWRD
jgi:N-sulfoglucosamine sulfohydrolase